MYIKNQFIAVYTGVSVKKIFTHGLKKSFTFCVFTFFLQYVSVFY